MTVSVNPVTIKKYGNRRLYNTTTSAYENLESLADMAKRGDDLSFTTQSLATTSPAPFSGR